MRALGGTIAVPADPGLSVLAGLAPTAHQDAAYDVLRATDQTAIASFRRSAADAVAARRFSAIITDGPGVPLGYPPSLSQYYRQCPQPLLAGVPAALFLPVAGAKVRPAYVWLPRGSGSCAAAVSLLDGPAKEESLVKSRVKSLHGQSAPARLRRSFWRSPVRGPWLTSVFGLAAAGVHPGDVRDRPAVLRRLQPGPQPGQRRDPGKGWLGFYLFSWPTHPVWLYRLNQGVHVTLGLVLVPILLFKLWSVLPKLFEWPPLRSPAHALERLSLFLLVGGAVFEFATGIMNIQTWYKFPGSFYPLHFYGAWVFIAGFVVHVPLKLPVMIRALRSRSFWRELRTNLAHTRPEPPDAGYLAPVAPAEPTISRRGVLAFAGAGSPWSRCCPWASHWAGRCAGPRCSRRAARTSAAPDDFQVNQTAASAGIRQSQTGAAWRLTLGNDTGAGSAPVVLDRAGLLRMEQHTASLPIACVEGWSTDNQAWAGVRLRDLARLAGVTRPSSVLVQSLERGGAFSQVGSFRGPDHGSGLAACPAGQRRGPHPGPRVPGPGDRARQSRRALHQVGRQPDLPELTCAASRAGTVPARCTCSPWSAASRSPGTPRPSCCRTTPSASPSGSSARSSATTCS